MKCRLGAPALDHRDHPGQHECLVAGGSFGPMVVVGVVLGGRCRDVATARTLRMRDFITISIRRTSGCLMMGTLSPPGHQFGALDAFLWRRLRPAGRRVRRRHAFEADR